KRARRLDRFSQFSVVGAQMALADADLDLTKEDRERVGANMGTALGGVSYAEGQLAVYLQQGLRAVDATLALTVFGGAASCNIAIELGAMGPNATNSMSCASGTIAIGDAFRQIRDGYADVMIAGGAEAPLAPLTFGAFALIRAMSTRNEEPEKASRPFDKDRDGFVMGEGAAVVILEEYERAKARGAPIYGEVVGYGITNDAHHMTAPRPDGSQAARAMRLALQDANVSADEIGYVNTHGSSTPLNDSTETMAIEQGAGEMRDAWRHFAAEFVGTFALVFVGSGAIMTTRISQSQAGLVEVALAHGLILAVMVSALMRISGHFNPAVTLGLLATRRIEAM